MQSCVLFVVNFSLTQTIYINLLCSLLCSLALYLSSTLVLCSLLHSFSPSPYNILYLYIYSCTGIYSVCKAMELAEVSSIPFGSPFIFSFNTLVEHVASQANKADEVTFYIICCRSKNVCVISYIRNFLPDGARQFIQEEAHSVFFCWNILVKKYMNSS
jgi:hypothetical protein